MAKTGAKTQNFLSKLSSSELFQLAVIIILLLTVLAWLVMTLYIVPEIFSEKKDEPYSWPTIAEAEELVKVEPFDPQHPWDSIPQVANKKYLNNLVQGIQYSECVKVVVGPRDSGKTIGITMLVDMWRKKGHTVVDINLKGMSEEVTWEGAVMKAAEGMYEVISTLDNAKYWCVLSTVRHRCFHIMARISKSVIWEVVGSLADSRSFVALLGIILPIIIKMVEKMVPQNYVNYMPHQSLLYLSMACAVIFSILVAFNYRSLLYDILTPGILNGNWNSLRCNLNAICECEPKRKPILIIREIGNFDDNALHECLASLERIKEGSVQYPVILETSSFSWLNVSSVYKSRLSFCPYYVEEMSQSELMGELVDKRRLWSAKEFKIVYEALGGHMGSYSKLYMYQKYHNLSIQESILKMKKEAIAHVCNCLINSRNHSEAILFLSALRGANFTLRTTFVSDAMDSFIKCNIVFYNPSELMAYPQNKLLHSAITTVLDENK